MNTLPVGIYIEDEKRFEFDFARYLLKISYLQTSGSGGSIVSPFRMVKNDGNLYLLIHNFDRAGERKIMIESMDQNELVINHENILYKLQKVA